MKKLNNFVCFVQYTKKIRYLCALYKIVFGFFVGLNN